MEYFAFVSSAVLLALLNQPAMPFFSGSSSVFSSTSRLATMSPISPMSRVLTFASAVSEKSAMFFCAAAPYCSTWLAFVRSICPANAVTACCSSGESADSSGPASGAASAFCSRSGSLTAGCAVSRSGVSVKVGIFCSSIVITPSQNRFRRSVLRWPSSSPSRGFPR